MNQILRKISQQKQIGNVIFRMLEPRDFEEAVELTAESFTTKEPLALALKYTKQEFYNQVYAQKDHFFSDGLSFVAEDTHSKRLVAAIFNDDYNSDLPQETIERFNSKSKDLIEYFDSIRGKIYKQNLFQSSKYILGRKNQVFHMAMAATGSEIENKGIYQLSFECCKEIAKSKGYSLLLSESTSPRSQYADLKWGMKIIYKEPYNTIQIGKQEIDRELISFDFRPGVTPAIRVLIKEI